MKPNKRKRPEKAQERSESFWRDKTSRFLKEAKAALISVNKREEKTMLFQLPEIDREATKKKIENLMDNYKVVLLQVPDDLLPKVKAGFNIVPPSNTNAFHSSTEDTAIKRIEMEQERNAFLSKIQKAVNRLPAIERQIIIMRYMLQDHRFDYEVYNEIGLNPRTYFRIKSRAFYNLAFALKEEVYVKGSAS